MAVISNTVKIAISNTAKVIIMISDNIIIRTDIGTSSAASNKSTNTAAKYLKKYVSSIDGVRK